MWNYIWPIYNRYVADWIISYLFEYASEISSYWNSINEIFNVCSVLYQMLLEYNKQNPSSVTFI